MNSADGRLLRWVPHLASNPRQQQISHVPVPCYCAAISSWITNPLKQLDFSLLVKSGSIRCANIEEMIGALGTLSWQEVHAMCKARRPQPLSPARFKEVLAGKYKGDTSSLFSEERKCFTRPDDELLVNELYETVFKGVFSEVEELDFSGLDWENVNSLQDTLSNAAALTHGETCPNLKVLWLLNNKIADVRTAKESLRKALGDKVHIFGLDPSGLKWRNVGTDEPLGGHALKLDNKRLAEALEKKTVFTEEQWKSFGIKSVDWPNFIHSGGAYFQPADDR